jgi:hypothetical protein
MTDTINLENLVDATNGGVKVVSENNDRGSINWRAGLLDPCEMAGVNGSVESLIEAGNAMANLAATADGRIMAVFADSAGWHELGTVTDGAMNGEDVLTLSGMDKNSIRFVLVPNHAPNLDGVWTPTGSYSVQRTDTGGFVTGPKAVGENFQIMEPWECVDILDAAINEGAKFETAGMLGEGERFWFLAKLEGVVDVAKLEQLGTYLLIQSANDGSCPTKAFCVDKRVECQNTLRRATLSGGVCHRIKHTKNSKLRVRLMKEAIAEMLGQTAHMAEMYSRLATTQLEPLPYFQGVLDDCLDVTIAGQTLTQANISDKSALKAILDLSDIKERDKAEKSYLRATRKRGKLLDEILSRYYTDRNNEAPNLGGTAYAAMNSVTEAIEHGQQFCRYNGEESDKVLNRFDSNLDGKADQYALENAIELTSAS